MAGKTATATRGTPRDFGSLVEEVTASSVSMGEQAIQLMELVSFFDVGDRAQT